MDWNHSRPDPPSTGTSGGFAAILNEALDVLMQGVRRAGIDGIDAIAGTGCFDESKLALT
jgi:hypothetical protein